MQAPPRPAYAQLYGWEQGYAARAADCGDCPALGARDAHAYSARVPYFGSGGELGEAVAEARADLGERFAEVAEPVSPRHGPVERYAHYPVSADEPDYFEFKEPPNGAVTTASVQ